MKQYFIGKDEAMTNEKLGKIINDFMLNCLPKLKIRYNYFLGIQKILQKEGTDTGKPCNRIVTNYVRSIVDSYKGYAVGVPVTYSSDNKCFEELMNIFNYNDINDEDTELFSNALIYGRGAEICYLDQDKKQRFKALNPKSIIPVYSNTLDQELLYVIRFWEEELTGKNETYYRVEVYDKYEVTEYKAQTGFTSFEFINKQPHYHNQVPIVIFSLNDEEEGIADQVFSLQDAYNSLLSDSVDDFDSFCDAYMLIKGMTADSDDLEDMKSHRVLLMDSDASAEYLTKDVSTQEIQNLLTTCEAKIREISCCPNFANESFNTSSGIAIRFRMLSMENKVAGIMNNFKKAIQKRIELLAEIIKLVSGEELWRDVNISFHRNLPTDLSTVASEINSFRGLVSDETLLSQIPFVHDVKEELKKIDEENSKKTSLYQNERLVDVEE